MGVNLIVIGPIAGEVYGCLQCKHTWSVSQETNKCRKCKSIICPNCGACHCELTQGRRLIAWGNEAYGNEGDVKL